MFHGPLATTSIIRRPARSLPSTYSAGNAKAMLRNFYKKGWDSWQKGVTQPPYAFLIPDNQGDPARVAAMVETASWATH